jgi:hypothetical protein
MARASQNWPAMPAPALAVTPAAPVAGREFMPYMVFSLSAVG